MFDPRVVEHGDGTATLGQIEEVAGPVDGIVGRQDAPSLT
jgi:hypothetical protein